MKIILTLYDGEKLIGSEVYESEMECSKKIRYLCQNGWKTTMPLVASGIKYYTVAKRRGILG